MYDPPNGLESNPPSPTSPLILLFYLFFLLSQKLFTESFFSLHLFTRVYSNNSTRKNGFPELLNGLNLFWKEQVCLSWLHTLDAFQWKMSSPKEWTVNSVNDVTNRDFSFIKTLRQKPKKLCARRVEWKDRLINVCNSFGFLPNDYCKRKTPRSWKDNI